jgi:hypothetical protein
VCKITKFNCKRIAFWQKIIIFAVQNAKYDTSIKVQTFHAREKAWDKNKSRTP